MYLKRLEMIGFKSFPEKIKLEFIQGVTAVVGPNGSGKSNVSDAIRWVLGEQSAKSLRGAKMEDVIFAGTANRKPLGYAEVSMIIDNSDRALNIDYSEVTVTRRVYRSGESGYQLNGTGCRLKDIQELFMDTGIGKEGYSIIGQGRIEEILASKSEDRRLLFEEAAGIVKYKTRRHESLSKLEKEKQNILRVNDIINEIEDQLGPLEIQSETAKKYLTLAERLKLTQINIFRNEVESFSDKIKAAEKDLSILNAQINQETILKERTSRQISALKNEEEITEENITIKNNELAELRSNIEQSESNIILFNEQKSNISATIENLEKEIKTAKENIDEKNILKNEINTEMDSLKNTLLENRKCLEEKLAEFEGFDNVVSAEENKIKEINNDILAHMDILSEVKQAIQKTEMSYAQLEEKKEGLNLKKAEYKSDFETQHSQKIIYQDKIFKLEQSISQIKNTIEILLDEKSQLNEEKAVTKREAEETSKNLQQLLSRHKILNELENNYEGYYKSVKNLLQFKKTNPSQLKGVIGAVGELIKVHKKYETAIEIALSQSVQNIITENEEDAKKAIEYLKRTNSGRATFLPISIIKPREMEHKEKLLQETGVVGIAKDLISYDPRFENIFSNLLGKVVIAENMQNGIDLSRKYNNSFKIVTLQGDLFNVGGSMTGGSIAQKANGIFSRSREIIEIQKDIKVYRDKEQELKNKLYGISRQLEAIYAQEEENRTFLNTFEVEIVFSKEQLSQIDNAIVKMKNEMTAIDIEDHRIMTEIADLNIKIREYEKKQISIEMDIQNQKDSLVEIQSAISERRLEKDSKSAEITELRINVSTMEEKLNSFLLNIDRIASEILEKENSIINSQKDLENKIIDLQNKTTEIIDLKNKIIELKNQYTQLQDFANELSNRKSLIRNELLNLEDMFNEKTEILSNLKNELTRLELRKENINEQIRSLYDTMWEEYELTYNQALKYEKLETSVSKLQSDERRFKSEIKALGHVNVAAIEEYKALKERYEFLSQQRNDILEAEEKLKDIISQLTELMEEQFSSHFKIISENFNIVFSEMFGGGRAYLKLSDEKNVLEAGIEIIAQPPGKNLQTLSLLSGGERALTAMALLFAILRMKPSPFCILDEIEAALDDANVYRYANYLKNFCSDTQFILITHRKGVMESADVLYGITMQEQGVSKLVSVKFEENKDNAEEILVS